MAIHSIKIGNNTEEINLKNKLTIGEKTYDGSAGITITASDLGLAAAMKFLGTCATAITDGAKTNPITIGSTSTTVTSGNVVLYDSKEFVWTGSAWEELGNEGSYKVVQAAVSDPAASGNATAFIDSISQDTNGKITVTKKNVNFPVSLPANGGNANTVDNKHASDFATSAQGAKADDALPRAGGNVTGHIYFTGAQAASSTGNTSQIIFGTSSNNHVAISSNDNAIVINPTSDSTTNQIVLYLDKSSSFPSGITANVTGTASNASKVTNSITFNNGGSGAASGTTFNGSAAKTISYNTIGAAPAILKGTTEPTSLAEGVLYCLYE